MVNWVESYLEKNLFYQNFYVFDDNLEINLDMSFISLYLLIKERLEEEMYE